MPIRQGGRAELLGVSFTDAQNKAIELDGRRHREILASLGNVWTVEELRDGLALLSQPLRNGGRFLRQVRAAEAQEITRG